MKPTWLTRLIDHVYDHPERWALTALVIALAILGLATCTTARADDQPWDPDKPIAYTPPPVDYNWAQRLAWNTKELPAAEWAWVAASLADIYTAEQALNYPNIEEKNIVLGKRPTDAQLIGYGLAITAAHMWLISYAQRDNAPRLAVYGLIGLGVLIRGVGIASNLQGIHDGEDYQKKWDAMQIGAGP